MNVQPKDLAMVVDAPFPWAGATCTVVKAVANPDPSWKVLRVTGPFWWVKMARPMGCWSVQGNHPVITDECVMPDALLRKIGGPDVNIQDVGHERLPDALRVVTL